MHPDVASIAFLLGTWVGEGEGRYPTIEDFRYGEEIAFREVGKPYVSYVQRTWALDDGRALHAESGYVRVVGPATLEYLLSHPTGLSELGGGRVAGQHVLLTARVARTPSALDVEVVERDLVVEGDLLRYELRMSMKDVPITRHLVAELRRVSS